MPNNNIKLDFFKFWIFSRGIDWFQGVYDVVAGKIVWKGGKQEMFGALTGNFSSSTYLDIFWFSSSNIREFGK